MSLQYPNPIERNINSTDPIGKVLARLEDLKPIIDALNSIMSNMTPPGGGITVGVIGSGTVNKLSKFTPNGTSIGDSLIFDDGTNIGIGTVTPENLLELVSTSNKGIRVSTNADNSYTGAKFQIEVGGGQWAWGFSAEKNAMTALTTGSTTGNFIFGYNTEISPIPRFFYNTDYMGIGVNIDFESLAAVGHFRMGAVGDPTDSIILAETSTGTTRFNVQNNGYTGIGIAPTEMLHVNGNIKTEEFSNGAGAWKLGKKITDTVALVTTDYIEVEIDSVIYKLGLVS